MAGREAGAASGSAAGRDVAAGAGGAEGRRTGGSATVDASSGAGTAELRLGMVGLDTSHCPAFARLLHDAAQPHHVPGGRVTVAFPGGSAAFAPSYTRVEGFTRQMRDEFGVEIVDSVEAVAERADAILLESVDGRQHLEQFARLAPSGKPVFIDKPLAASVREARAIFDLARRHGAPVMSCSSLRFAEGIAGLAAGLRVEGCISFGPAELREDFPGYGWYGIHAVEVLLAKMGRGCAEVRVQAAPQADVLTGQWRDGRVGAAYLHRIRGAGTFGCTVFTERGALGATDADAVPPYASMLREVLAFFRTRRSPVAEEDMLEVIAFVEAADRSRATGQAVPVETAA